MKKLILIVGIALLSLIVFPLAKVELRRDREVDVKEEMRSIIDSLNRYREKNGVSPDNLRILDSSYAEKFEYWPPKVGAKEPEIWDEPVIGEKLSSKRKAGEMRSGYLGYLDGAIRRVEETEYPK